MKINQKVKFGTSYNTKIFKISAGFPLIMKTYHSPSSALCRARPYEHSSARQLYLKKPRDNKNIDRFDHLYEAILCDSCCVFPGLARGASVLNFALSKRPPICPK